MNRRDWIVVWATLAGASCVGGEGRARCEGDAQCAPCAGGACAELPAPPPCSDAFEPNDDAASAWPLDPGVVGGLTLCSGDEDWFAIALRREDRLSVTVEGEGAASIGLALHGPTGALLVRAEGREGGARLTEIRPNLAGTYRLRVTSATGEPATYGLRVERVARSCAPQEPLALSAADRAPDLPASASAVVAAGRSLFYRAALAAGGWVRAQMTHVRSAGALELSLWRPVANALWPAARAEREDRQEVRYGPASEAEEVFVRVASTDAQENRFELASEGGREELRFAGTLAGVARYEDRRPLRVGLGRPRPAPIAWAEIELFREQDGHVVGTGRSGTDGRFAIPFVTWGTGALAARVLSRSDPLGLEVLRAETCPEVYAVHSEAVSPSAEPPQLEVLARADALGGAFNILDVLVRASERLERAGFPELWPLTAYWERGFARNPCGTCYYDSKIFLGGTENDPDEYDDAVIAHELGHHFEDRYGRSDSPGGEHAGGTSAPPLAWSEGFATFLSSAVRGSSLYADSTGSSSGWWVDIERDQELGTEDGTSTGWLSEWLVAGTLWDLLDGIDDAELDGIARPLEDVLLPATAYFRGRSFADRGAAGADLVDYLDGWFCHGLGAREEMVTLLAAKRFPYDFGGPTGCSPSGPRQGGKPRSPIALRLEVDPVGPGGTLRVRASARARSAGGVLHLRLEPPAGWRLAGSAEAVEARGHAALEAEIHPGSSPGRILLRARLLGGGGGAGAVLAWPPGEPR